jgi:caffeoyl-CoA O-methyltransferase
MLTLVEEKIESYVMENTQEVEPVFEQLRKETYETTSDPQMQVGKVEGTFLRILVSIMGARRVLELGTFTGYSALMMAAALPDDGVLYTLDNNEEHLKIARKYFSMVDYGNRIVPIFGNALDTLGTLDELFDMAFIDADKENYPVYYEMVMDRLRSGGIILFDNMLRKGDVLNPKDERARATAALNERITEDERVENVLLTVRDGIMLVRKR